MRFVSCRRFGEVRFGALAGDQVIDLNRSCAALFAAEGASNPALRAGADCPADAVAFIAAGAPALDAARRAMHWAAGRGAAARKEGLAWPLAEAQLLAPIPRPSKLVCVGLNYADHAAEVGRKQADVPTVFAKLHNTVTGPGPVQKPRVSDALDHEVELAVVVGKKGRNIPAAEVMAYVFGYTVANDVSVRDYQMRTANATAGKIFDTHCPMGPALVTADEVPDPHNLEIWCEINGERRQHANTHQFIFNLPRILSYLSDIFTLEPGDVVLTGSPAGTGVGQTPPLWLQVGDRMVSGIDGIGRLENVIVPQP